MKPDEKISILYRKNEPTNEISVQVDSERLDNSIDSGYFISCTKKAQKIKAIRQKCFSINSDIAFPQPKRSKSVENNNNGRLKHEPVASKMVINLKKISRIREKTALHSKMSISSKTKNIRYNSEYQNIKTPKIITRTPSKVTLISENFIDITLKSNYRSPVIKLDRGCEYKKMSNVHFKPNHFREPLMKIHVLDTLIPTIKAIGRHKIS